MAAGCQRAYLSQVLNSEVHLTPDHAAGLAEYFGGSSNERDYFLELVNHARAGGPILKKIIQERLRKLKAKNESVTGRLSKPKIDKSDFQIMYYSSWYFSAIHILITISKFRTISAIAERLNLSRNIVSSALLFLAEAGLAEKRGESWNAISFDLHLPSNSPLSSINHHNWRAQAVQKSRQASGSDNIHFTAVYSLSQKDFLKLRTRILDIVSESREIALKSAEEDLFSVCFDAFSV